jgi:hypothetical protein
MVISPAWLVSFEDEARLGEGGLLQLSCRVWGTGAQKVAKKTPGEPGAGTLPSSCGREGTENGNRYVLKILNCHRSADRIEVQRILKLSLRYVVTVTQAKLCVLL